MTRIRCAIVALLGLAAAQGVVGQEYPTRSVTLVVPFSAGGPTDVLTRILAQAMSKPLKQQIVVLNAAGAGGTIGSTKVARAKPDGYTLLLHHNGMATSPALYRKLLFNPLTDFETIGLIANVPMTLVGRKDLPPNNLKELIGYIKKNKEDVKLGNASLGAVSHLCGMLFMSAIESVMTPVPYKGTQPAMNDLLAGQVDLLCDQTSQTTSYIKSGRIKAFGVTSKTRIASLPNVATLREQGLANFELMVWHGLYAPKGTPKPVLDKLVNALQQALKDASVKARLADLGAEPVAAAQAQPGALRAHLQAEIEKWRPIIAKAGVYAD